MKTVSFYKGWYICSHNNYNIYNNILKLFQCCKLASIDWIKTQNLISAYIELSGDSVIVSFLWYLSSLKRITFSLKEWDTSRYMYYWISVSYFIGRPQVIIIMSISHGLGLSHMYWAVIYIGHYGMIYELFHWRNYSLYTHFVINWFIVHSNKLLLPIIALVLLQHNNCMMYA